MENIATYSELYWSSQMDGEENKKTRLEAYENYLFDDKFNGGLPDDRSLMYMVQLKVNPNTNEIENNFVAPCIIWEDKREGYDQFFIEPISEKRVDAIKKIYCNREYLAPGTCSAEYIKQGHLYVFNKANMYSMFKDYNVANDYRYAKWKEIMDSRKKNEKTIITMSMIEEKFGVKKNKIIFDFSK